MRFLKKRFRTFLPYLGILTILLALSGQVRSTGIATGSYFLDIPLPIADYYIGYFTNGTYFVCNGTNWNCYEKDTVFQRLLNFAIANASADGYGHIIIGSGLFNMSSFVTYGSIELQSNVWLEGSGRDITTIIAPTDVTHLAGTITNANIGTGTADENITLSNFGLNNNWSGGNGGNDPNRHPHGIKFWGVNNVLIENLNVFDGGRNGIEIAGNSAQQKSYNVKIFNCVAWDWGNNGFTFAAVNQGDTYDSTIEGCRVTKTDTGISVDNVDSVSILNCWAINNTNGKLGFTNNIGIAVEGSSGLNSTNVFVSGNYAVNHTADGFFTKDAIRVTFEGNFAYDNGGAGFAAGGDTDEIFFVGNTATEGKWGFKAGSGSGDIWNIAFIGNTVLHQTDGSQIGFRVLNNVNSTLIKDNSIIDCNNAMSIDGYARIFDNSIIHHKWGGGAGIVLENDADNSIVRGNLFDNITGNSITLNAGADGVTIEYNIFLNYNTQIADAATNTLIKLNTGYVTENSGIQVVSSGENIAHGLVSTPIWACITPLNCTYDDVAIIATLNYSSWSDTYLLGCVFWVNGTAIDDDVILVAWEARTWY